MNCLLSITTFLVLFTIATVLIGKTAAETEDLSDKGLKTFQEYLKKNKVVVAKYVADWCPHCVDSKDAYEEAAKLIGENSADVKVIFTSRIMDLFALTQYAHNVN